MKNFICAILICLMLPITSFALSGCDTNNYDIKTFYTDYQEIVKDCNNLLLDNANNYYQPSDPSSKIVINYSKSSKISTLVEISNTSYYQLKYFYQKLLDDSLSPLYVFGSSIAKSDNVSDNQTKKLFKHLEALKQEYLDIDYYLGILIKSLDSTDDTFVNSSNLKKVFMQYEQAIDCANKLSSVVCNVYFKTVLSNSNFNYSSMTYDKLTDTDLSKLALDTRARIYYYKSVYANVYYQLYVRDNNLAYNIAFDGLIPSKDYAPYFTLSSITSVAPIPTASLVNFKQQIHTYAVELYNVQNSFEIAYKYFNIATNKIAYNSLDINSSTVNEINYGIVITDFAYGIAYDSCEILLNLIDLLLTTV